MGLFVSNEDFVYLTKDAPLYYAAIAVQESADEDKTGAVVRVDLEKLETSLLRPDEDYFYSQSPLRRDAPEADIKRLIAANKQKAKEHPEAWEESLESDKCGSIAHLGEIPATAVMDVTFVDFFYYSPIHHAVVQVGEKVHDRTEVLRLHRSLMRWVYGGLKLDRVSMANVLDLAATNQEVPLGIYLQAAPVHHLLDRKGFNHS
jgi:hypothetical protein